MHDIDRTQFEADEFESAYGGEFEQPELEQPLYETQELELASSLLEVSNELELEQFIGDLFRMVGRAAGGFAHSDTGRALGGMLKDTIRQALPGSAGAIGPALGGPLGSGVAQQAGSLLGLELEGLSPQDQEFETARQLVRLAGSAYRNAVLAPRTMPPPAIARAATLAAARRYAPGLLRALGARGGYGGGWASRPGYGVGSAYRYGYAPRLGYTPGYGTGWRYGPGYGSGLSAGAGRPYDSAGYYQPVPSYWRRRRPRYAWGYGQPPYRLAYGAYRPPEPDVGAFAEPPAEPLPPPQAIPVPEPEPAPPAAEPTAPASSSELEFFGGTGWRPRVGVGGPAARNGRWVRRGGVLIVYGA